MTVTINPASPPSSDRPRPRPPAAARAIFFCIFLPIMIAAAGPGRPVDVTAKSSTIEPLNVPLFTATSHPEPGPVVNFGLFGVGEEIEGTVVIFKYARLPALDPAASLRLRVTHYGSPRFPPGNHVARWPMTLSEAKRWSEDLGLSGVCAVDRGTPWWRRVRDDRPPLLWVEGVGCLLAVDRVGHGTDVDVYVPDSSRPLYAGDRDVWEVAWPDG